MIDFIVHAFRMEIFMQKAQKANKAQLMIILKTNEEID